MRKRSRYANVMRHKLDGHTFDSTKEMFRYHELKLLVRAAAIRDLEVHPRIKIEIGGVKVVYPGSGRQMVYIADFKYYDAENMREVVEDVKMQSGHRTEVYKIKRALVAAMGIEIVET